MKESELLLFADALYYLRRPINKEPELAHDLLEHHLREVEDSIASPGECMVAELRVAEELASWLNEHGRWEMARPLLERIEKLLPTNSYYTGADRARFYRQIAYNTLASRDLRQVDEFLAKALHYDPPQQETPCHNEIAILTTKAPLVFVLGVDPKTREQALELFDVISNLTDEGYDPSSKAGETEISNATMRGILVYLPMLLIETHKAKALELLEGLADQAHPEGRRMEYVNNVVVQEAFAKLQSFVPDFNLSRCAEPMSRLPDWHAPVMLSLAKQLLRMP